jgi:hypothetical protein
VACRCATGVPSGCRTPEHGAVFPAQRPRHFDDYDDDGETSAYQHGQYFLQRIGSERVGPVMSVELPAEHRAQIRVVSKMR